MSPDEFTVTTMVVPIGLFPKGAVLPNGEISRGGLYFTCRHLQENGDCAIYDERPKMCREFPNGPTCPHVGCTYSPACA